MQENHYYPFGLQLQGPWNSNLGTDTKYTYNGKELNEDFGLNWLDYSKRWYDPAIARFPSIDPQVEKYYPFSPYNYVANNPINSIDPQGDTIVILGSEEFVQQATFDLLAISTFDGGEDMFNELMTSEYTIQITEASSVSGDIADFFSKGSGNSNHVKSSRTAPDHTLGSKGIGVKYS